MASILRTNHPFSDAGIVEDRARLCQGHFLRETGQATDAMAAGLGFGQLLAYVGLHGIDDALVHGVEPRDFWI